MSVFDHGGWRPSETRFLDIIDEPRISALVKLQNLVTVETTRFWDSRGVLNMHLPLTTNSISSPMGLGSDSEPVSVMLFDQRTYLADSMQFMLEYGCRFSDRGAWYLMPSFRGEDADETHLNQFFHSEAEIPGGLEDVIQVIEDYLRHLAAAVLQRLQREVSQEAGGVDHITAMVTNSNFTRITFDEAVDILGDRPDYIRHEADYRTLTRAGEQQLLSEVAPILWVTEYDHLSVPFYQAYDVTGTKALNADLLFGFGEIVGCGERHSSSAQVLDALRRHDVEPAAYEWYTSMKKHRPLRTAGFGLGVERWMMWVLGAQDIRELQLAPRLNGVSLQP